MKRLFYAILFLSVIYGCSSDDANSSVNSGSTQNQIYLTAWFVTNQSGSFNPPNHIGIYRIGERINMRDHSNGNESIPRAEVRSGDNIVIRYDIGLAVGSTTTMRFVIQQGSDEILNGENVITNNNPMASGHDFFNLLIP